MYSKFDRSGIYLRILSAGSNTLCRAYSAAYAVCCSVVEYMLSFLRKLLYVLIQCTWGILQTLVGFIVFLLNIGCHHYLYHGSVVTVWNSLSSVSLGMFLFVAKGSETMLSRSGRILPTAESGLVVHEYGHTIQSLVLGPLYFPVIGLPSVLWANLPRCRNKRINGVPYAAFWTEKSANRLGELATGEKSFGNQY